MKRMKFKTRRKRTPPYFSREPFSPLKDKVRNLTRTPDKQKRKGGTDCPKLAKSCRYLACLHRAHFKRFTMVLQLKEVNYEIDIQHLLLRKER